MIKKGYADTNMGQIHYRMTAGREGLPVVLLHQTPSHSGMFEKLMNLANGDFQWFAPDNPGFGGTTASCPQGKEA